MLKRRFPRHRVATARPLIELLDPRRLLSSADAVLVDNGAPFNLNGPQLAQVANRWTSTASGSTGSTGTGITLTYSIVPDGTPLSTGIGEPAANSDLRAELDSLYTNQSTWLPIIQSVFNSWSAISGVTYVYEPNDDGAAYSNGTNGVLGVRGDVRIGAHPLDGASGTLAYNWFPSYGDMVIDSNDLSSGGYLSNLSNNSLRLRNTMAHEHGHGLGFNHADPLDHTKLMEAYLNTNFDGPQYDDMVAVNRNYGDFFEKGSGNNSFTNAINRGTLGDGTDAISNVSVATTSDRDYYKFSLASTKRATITASPFGPTYLQGPQNGATSSFNGQAQMDLQLQLLASDGTTVLATANNTALGAAEAVDFGTLAAGTYYIRVMPAPGATDNTQMYNLTTNVGAAVANTTNVAITGGNLVVTDTGAKADVLTLKADTSNSRYIVSDLTNFIGTSIGTATGGGTHYVFVPFSAVTGGQITLSTLDGNDSIQINGTSIPVAVDAGIGTDTIDVVESSSPVSILASGGNDSVSVNADNSGAAAVAFPTSEQLNTLTIGAGGVATVASTGNPSASNLLTVQSLAIAAGGKLNLRDNDLSWNYSSVSPVGTWNGSAYTQLTGLVASGRNGGSWDGNGITTSTASGTLTSLGVAEASQALGISALQTALFDGQTVDGTTVLVKFTYTGDANLDGKINVDDYTRIDASQPLNVTGWFNGDFNYDGKLNVDDYTIIDFNVGIQGVPL